MRRDAGRGDGLFLEALEGSRAGFWCNCLCQVLLLLSFIKKTSWISRRSLSAQLFSREETIHLIKKKVPPQSSNTRKKKRTCCLVK